MTAISTETGRGAAFPSLTSDHDLSFFGSSVAEIAALRSAACRHVATGHAITDDALLAWKRGRGGERHVATPRKAAHWLKLAREVVAL